MLFSIISIIIFNIIAFIIPKSLTKYEIYATSFFAYVLSSTADLILTEKYHLYHYFDKGIQYMDIVAMIGIYPAISVIFLNLYPYKK
jgi:hypothetical protein